MTKSRLIGLTALAMIAVAPAPALATHTVTSSTQTTVGSIVQDFGAGGGTATGSLAGSQLAFFTFFATAGDSVGIRTNAVDGGFDTGLSLLFKPSGPVASTDLISSLTVLAEDDDSGGGLLSLINYNITQTGNYAFALGGFAGDSGNYSVTLRGNTGVGAVPEPGTWALMLLGFGAIGVSLRKRRSFKAAGTA